MAGINYKHIRFSILGVFILFFGVIIWYSETDYHIKKDYLDFKKIEFNTTVFHKEPSKLKNRGHKLHLKKGPHLIVFNELFDKVNEGGSVYKKSDSDSIFFKNKLWFNCLRL